MADTGELFGQTSDAEIAALLERAPELRDAAHRWPRTLVELVDVLEAHFKRSPAEPDPRRQAEAAVMVIAHYLGGKYIYLPRDTRLQNAIRDAGIWRAFNGRNREQLADAHRLTVRQIDNILAEQRALHRKRNQPELFPPSP